MTAPNVLIVTVDCLRRDRISAYGHPQRTTPVLDGLLETSLHAPFAHAASSWTAPSVASLFTGRYPFSHGGGLLPGEPKNLSRDQLPTALPAAVPILPELLPTHASAAFLGVWNAALPFAERLGHTESKERDAPALVQRSLRWMEQQRQPWMCWVHLREPHDPLSVPRGFRESFGDIGSYSATRRWAFTDRDDDVSTPAFSTYRERRARLYDAAVLAADRAIGELLAGIDDDTIVVITADHGEEMWEYRDDEIAHLHDPRGIAGVGHGHALWQTLLLVPLIICGPGVAPQAVEGPTSLVDVLPTILGALGTDPPPTLDGRDLQAPEDAGRTVFAEGVAYGNEQQVVVDATHALYRSPTDGFQRCSTLHPTSHTESGSTDDPDIAGRLSGAIDARGPTPQLGSPIVGTDEIEENLRSLGYIE